MSTISAVLFNGFGRDLTEFDYKRLEARWLTPDNARDAGIRRVDSITGREMFGRKYGDCAGLPIPNVLPGDHHVREWKPSHTRRESPRPSGRKNGRS